ncbi:MAG: DinB family protein [Chloroflexota bacterium]
MPKKVTEAQIRFSLQTLRETPQRLVTLTSGIDESRLRAAPQPKEWSMVEILAHLRASADLWSYSIYAMLTLDSPELAHIHPRNWEKMQGYHHLTFAENLLAFQVGRANLLRILEPLSFANWDRSARFVGRANATTIFGETLRMALHESDHWQQLDKTIAAV